MERILVADDDKDVLTAIELLLDREQMEALLVGSPAEAVDAVKTNSFAAVLLDLNFSLDTTAGQEGIALIDRLKALDETLPIIVMTGWGTVSIATQAMQAGAADFIEEKRASIGQLETPNSGVLCIGEGAFDMSEHLALK